MKRKQPIPAVDEAALAALAEQFPSGRLPPSEPPQQDNAPLALGEKEIRGLQSVASAASGAALRRQPGRGLAAGALILALLALAIAVAATMPATARLWLTRAIGDSPVVDLVTADQAALDRRLDTSAQSLEALAGQQRDVAARLAAVETAVGTGAAGKRLDAVEAGLAAVREQVGAAGDAQGTASARAEALDARLTSHDEELQGVQQRVATTERNVNEILGARLGAVEADIGALQKIDRRPERLYLTALQLREAVRSGAPFSRELAAAQAAAGDDAKLAAALQALGAGASHGVATIAELRDSFGTVLLPRLAAVAAANRQPVAQRAWDYLQSFFAASGSSQAVNDRNSSVIALAARSLSQDQLAAAVHQLLLLEDDAAVVAAEWLKTASERLAADKAIATVMSQALDQLAGAN